MLEARILVKLARAQAMMECKASDAYDEIDDANLLAKGSSHEIMVANIAPTMPVPDEVVGDDGETDEAFNKRVGQILTDYDNMVRANLQWSIQELENAIGNKIHRRNLQIADLKGKPIEHQIARCQART